MHKHPPCFGGIGAGVGFGAGVGADGVGTGGFGVGAGGKGPGPGDGPQHERKTPEGSGQQEPLSPAQPGWALQEALGGDGAGGFGVGAGGGGGGEGVGAGDGPQHERKTPEATGQQSPGSATQPGWALQEALGDGAGACLDACVGARIERHPTKVTPRNIVARCSDALWRNKS